MLLQQRHTTHLRNSSFIYYYVSRSLKIWKWSEINKKILFFVLLLQFNYGDLKHMEGIHCMKLKTWNNGNAFAVARFSLRLIKEPSFAGWCELEVILFKWYKNVWYTCIVKLSSSHFPEFPNVNIKDVWRNVIDVGKRETQLLVSASEMQFLPWP